MPQRVVDIAGRASGGLPVGEQLAELGAGRTPIRGIDELLGLDAELLLGLAGTCPLAVQFREMRSAPSVECLPRRRIALPQRIVGFAVQAADRLPFVEDRAQPVAGDFPLRRGVGQFLGLGGQGLFAGGLGRAMLVATRAVGGGGGFGVLSDAGQPRGQRIDISEHIRGRQRLGQPCGGGFDLACIAGTRGQPLFQQRDLGAQVVEPPTEVGERRFGVAGLPGPDDPLAGRADQPHRSVVVDAAEPVRIAGRRRNDRMGVGTGCRSGPGPRYRAAGWAEVRCVARQAS